MAELKSPSGEGLGNQARESVVPLPLALIAVHFLGRFRREKAPLSIQKIGHERPPF